MFNMDVNQIQLLEMGLNALGFVAGGGILVVLASIFRRKERNSMPAEAVTETTPPTKEQLRQTPKRDVNRGFQFIDLSDRNEKSPSKTERPSGTTQSRRNRAEVYELAQRMLQSRKPTRDISDELGMTQAEVSLLKARSEQHKGEQHV